MLEPKKLVRTAKEIQRHVQKQLEEAEEKRRKKEEEENEAEAAEQDSVKNNSSSNGRKRSASVDSSKFVSPKRSLKSATPDLMI